MPKIRLPGICSWSYLLAVNFVFGLGYKPLITVANANNTQAAISRKVEYSLTTGRSTPSTGRVPSAPMITAMIHVIFIGDLNCILPPNYLIIDKFIFPLKCLYIIIINILYELSRFINLESDH